MSELVDLVDLLQNIHKLDGVVAVSIVNSQGNEIAFSADENAIDGNLHAKINDYVRCTNALAAVLGISEVDRHHAVLLNNQVMIESFENGTNLLVFTSHDCTNQGRVRLEIRKNKAKIESVLKTL